MRAICEVKLTKVTENIKSAQLSIEAEASLLQVGSHPGLYNDFKVRLCYKARTCLCLEGEKKGSKAVE